jgi:hypothetical protein
VLDKVLPPEIPIPPLAEVQVALNGAAERVTGETGDVLKRRLRTGTVVSTDDRNWELKYSSSALRFTVGGGWVAGPALPTDVADWVPVAHGARLFLLSGQGGLVYDPAAGSPYLELASVPSMESLFVYVSDEPSDEPSESPSDFP